MGRCPPTGKATIRFLNGGLPRSQEAVSTPCDPRIIRVRPPISGRRYANNAANRSIFAPNNLWEKRLFQTRNKARVPGLAFHVRYFI